MNDRAGDIAMEEPLITLTEQYPTTLKYQPRRDEDWRVVEDELAYAERMRSGPLASWPHEVLVEWLHRHANDMEVYCFLGFERLRFERVTWPADRIPGAAAFRDETFCRNFQNVEERAAYNRHDWLAHYMLREGTWNTPIVLLDSTTVAHAAHSARLKTPFHLLEGHRRLAFLEGLRRLGKARPKHIIWLARHGA
jgi:hypothetical protein